MHVWYFPSMSRHHLKMNLAGLCRPAVVVDCFYISLFSALEQTHCALVACDSKRVTRFLQRALNIHQNCVLTALLGRYMAGAT